MAFLVLVLAFILKASGVAVFCKTYTDQTTCVADELCVWTKPAAKCDGQPVAADCEPANTCNATVCDHTPGVPAKCEEEIITCVSLTTEAGCSANAGCSWTPNSDECVGDTWAYSNNIQCKLWPTIVLSKQYGTCRAGAAGYYTGNCVEKSAPQCVEKVAGSGKICQLNEDKTVCSGDDAEYCDYVAAICGPIFDCPNPINGSCNATQTLMGCVAGGSCSGTFTPPGAACTGITPAAQGDCTAVTNCKFIQAVTETCTPKNSVSCVYKCVVKNNGGENNSVSSWDKEAAFTIRTPFSVIALLIFVLFV